MSESSFTKASEANSTDVDGCIRILRRFVEDPASISEREQIERLVARVYKRVRKDRRRQSELRRMETDSRTIAETGRVQVEVGPGMDQQHAGIRREEFLSLRGRSRICFVCKSAYRKVHHFYHLLCPECARFNYSKRTHHVDLTGRQALVTGARLKIGYQTALALLRSGACVAITTRFPRDSAARYAAEPDYCDFQDRLSIWEADFRDVPGLLHLIDQLTRAVPALDILINNAAQTVRMSPENFARLRQMETVNIRLANLECSNCIEVQNHEVALETTTDQKFPVGWTIDRHGELIDACESNAWTQRLTDVEPLELLEMLLVNANAPCLLASRLKPLFLRSQFPDRYIINVTGRDGSFTRSKTTRHPHVNMSKAAVNMMTRTSSVEYARSGIYMNSVDTGWITNLGSYSHRIRRQQKGFIPPFDEMDGAARILDPIYRGVLGQIAFGKLFKHFQVADW